MLTSSGYGLCFCTVQRSDICVHVLCNTIEKQLMFSVRSQLCWSLPQRNPTKTCSGVGVLMNTHDVQQFALGWSDICCVFKWTQQKLWMVEEILWLQDNALSSAQSAGFLCFFEQVYPQNCVIQLFIKWRKIFSNPGLSPSGMCAPVRQHTQTDKDSYRCGYGYEVNLNLLQRGEKWRKSLEKLPKKRI